MHKAPIFFLPVLNGLMKIFIPSWGKKEKEPIPSNVKLFNAAETMIGFDASPLDFVGDDLGCAESVCNIINQVIELPIITGTWTLWNRFRNDRRFQHTLNSREVGTIIISPTGTGNGSIRGHVGIVGENETIMSANSFTGRWEYNYTLKMWRERYEKKGGFPTYYYKLI